MDQDKTTVAPSKPLDVSRDVDLAETQDIGPYRILSLLGEGGFGSVYLAEQVEPIRRRVALKVIKPGMDSRAVVARFEAERQALALMDHPGIAQVYDADVTKSGRPYFAMEYVSGEPIHKFCDHERLGLEARVRLMIQVCEAVQHAHMKGLIHRDLKPGNVLVGLVDGRPAPKVIDFGVAKALHQRLTDSTMHTEIGQMIGTPEYMSPEQARGSAVDVDTRADVYSLGAILYELLTGETPMERDRVRAASYADLQRMILDETPPRPSDRFARLLRSGETTVLHTVESGTAGGGGGGGRGSTGAVSRMLRQDLDWVVMKCLEKDRARRYDSASALARDLERFLADEPVEAGPPSARYRVGKFVQRHRAGVAAAMLAGLALLVGVAGLSIGLVLANRARDRAERAQTAAEEARAESDAATVFLTDMLSSVSAAEKGGGKDVLVRDVLDRAAMDLGGRGASGAGTAGRFAGKPVLESRVRHAIGNSYRALGRLEDADGQLSRVYETRRVALGEEHPDTLTALGNLAGLRQEQGKYEEAKGLNQRALAGYERIGKADGAGAMGVVNNLANIEHRVGSMDRAEELQRRAADGLARVRGVDDPDALGARLNLGNVLIERGKIDEGEHVLVAAADRWRTVHGEGHPGTLLSRYMLGSMYLATSRPREAEAEYRSLVEARERVLGAEHPDTIAARSNLALSVSMQGRTQEAARLYRAAWEGAAAALGEDHPDTITTAANLLGAYEAMGWPAEGEDVTRRVMPVLVRLSREAGDGAAGGGARGRGDANELNTLAWFLLEVKPEELRDAAAALRVAERACDLERRASGGAGEAGNLWQYLDSLALAQFRTGAAATAVRTQTEAIRLLPARHAEQYRGEMEGRLREYEAGVR